MHTSKVPIEVDKCLEEYRVAWKEYKVAHRGHGVTSANRQRTLMREHVTLDNIQVANGNCKGSLGNLLVKEEILKSSWKALKAVMRKQNQNMR